jgi:hypothetical protein
LLSINALVIQSNGAASHSSRYGHASPALRPQVNMSREAKDLSGLADSNGS